MAERYRALSLKPIKQLIAAGEYSTAETALLARRQSLLALLEHSDCDEAKVGLILTCVSSLLVECNSLAGKVVEAESWYGHALQYCSESHDPMVRLRIHRVYAMHLYRTGNHDDALIRLEEVIRELLSRKFQLASGIPLERAEVELAYSTSCKAEVMTAQHPDQTAGAELALGVRSILRAGSKPRYELQNLMVCLSGTSRLREPVLHRLILMRAWYLNERFVHNGSIRTRLIDHETMLPVASTALAALGRVFH